MCARKYFRTKKLYSLGVLLALAGCDPGTSAPEPAFDIVNSNAATDQGLDWLQVMGCSITGTCIAAWVSSEDEAEPIPPSNAIYYSKRVVHENDAWSPRAVLSDTVGDMDIDWNPALATSNDGTWICAWEHGGAMGSELDILVSRSLDDGDTWEASKVVSGPDPRSDVEPSICTDGAGNWVVAWDAPGIPQESQLNYPEHDLFVTRSTDNGLNWTPVVPLNNTAVADLNGDVEVSLVSIEQGIFMATWNCVPRFETVPAGILVSRSLDAGASWTDPVSIADHENDGYFRRRPRVASNEDGRVVLVWATVGGFPSNDSYLEYSISTDGGTTWGTPVPLNVSSPDVQLEPSVGYLSPSRWLIAWTYATDLAQMPWSYGVAVSESNDDGRTWAASRVLVPRVDPPALVSGSEPRIAGDAIGRWMVVFSMRSDTAIDTDIGSAVLR